MKKGLAIEFEGELKQPSSSYRCEGGVEGGGAAADYDGCETEAAIWRQRQRRARHCCIY